MYKNIFVIVTKAVIATCLIIQKFCRIWVVDNFQICLSCHSFLDWDCVQCSCGRALVTCVFYLRNNRPCVLLLGHKFT